MTHSEILSKVDHTNLSQTATWEDIKSLCDDAVTCRTASVCIPPAFVKRAKEYTGNSMAVCTVIGFPNGYHTTEAKAFETRNALENGADEIDMVIHVGALKEKNEAAVLKEISELKKLCGSRILKVIIEKEGKK